jgi:hypothetical protein
MKQDPEQLELFSFLVNTSNEYILASIVQCHQKGMYYEHKLYDRHALELFPVYTSTTSEEFRGHNYEVLWVKALGLLICAVGRHDVELFQVADDWELTVQNIHETKAVYLYHDLPCPKTAN